MHASLYASAPAQSANGALPLDRARPTPFDYLDDDDVQLPPGGVYSTEAYPTAFLPDASPHSADCTSSTDSTPVTSPTLYPSRRGANSSTSVGDDGAFALPSATPSRIVRKPSKALMSHRNSLLDPIVEEPTEAGR